jgi:hypothetical protein
MHARTRVPALRVSLRSPPFPVAPLRALAAALPPSEASTEDTGLDADGFHVISNRGKFAEKLNPLHCSALSHTLCISASVRPARHWMLLQ